MECELRDVLPVLSADPVQLMYLHLTEQHTQRRDVDQ